MKDPTTTTEKKSGQNGKKIGFFQDFRNIFKDETGISCRKWIVVKTLRGLGTRAVTPFIPLWMLTVKGAEPYVLGIMGSVAMFMTMIFQIPAGKLSDKIGRKKTFYLFVPFMAIGTLLLILAPGPEYLILVGLLGAYGLQGGVEGLDQ